MKEIVINLELTSICNRKCVVCPQGDPDFEMSKKDMSLEDFDIFLNRVEEVGRDGVFVREIINSGYGETLIHKNLKEVFEKYRDFKTRYSAEHGRAPAISVVTNGSAISDEKLDIVSKAVDIIKFSFPTSDIQQYGKIMYGDESYGADFFASAQSSLIKCMEGYRNGKIPELRVHISPPVQHSHEHFPETLDFLTKLAASINLDDIRLVIFPSTSNRAGTVPDQGFVNDFYRDFRKRYDRKKVNGVKVLILSELKVFFPSIIDVVKVLGKKFPCIWKAGSISIDSSGNYRICINDAASRIKLGNIANKSLNEALLALEQTSENLYCKTCNQNPYHMGDDAIQKVYSSAARLKLKFFKKSRS